MTKRKAMLQYEVLQELAILTKSYDALSDVDKFKIRYETYDLLSNIFGDIKQDFLSIRNDTNNFINYLIHYFDLSTCNNLIGTKGFFHGLHNNMEKMIESYTEKYCTTNDIITYSK